MTILIFKKENFMDTIGSNAQDLKASNRMLVLKIIAA